MFTTPLLKNKNPDMSSLFNAAKKISPFLGKGKIIILESTVYPGATVDLIKKFNLKNLKLGEDIFISTRLKEKILEIKVLIIKKHQS